MNEDFMAVISVKEHKEILKEIEKSIEKMDCEDYKEWKKTSNQYYLGRINGRKDLTKKLKNLRGIEQTKPKEAKKK